MELTFLCKDENSGNGGCPSAYLADTGEMVVQAPAVDADTFGNLRNVLPGEQAVRIDPEVILRAAEMYKRRKN